MSKPGQHVVPNGKKWRAGAANVGAKRILDKYTDFQEWYFEMHRNAGAVDEDIKEYPTKEFLEGMIARKAAGEPPTFP